MNFLAIVSACLFVLVGVSEAGRDCTVCENIELSSPSSGPVTRTAITGAAKIKKISLRSEQSTKGTCIKDSTYGFIGADVFVDMGCSGTFKVCYIKGRTEILSCDSDGSSLICDYSGGECEVQSAVVTTAKSDHPCTRDYSFRATPNGLVVSKGCQGTFVIGCEECD